VRSIGFSSRRYQNQSPQAQSRSVDNALRSRRGDRSTFARTHESAGRGEIVRHAALESRDTAHLEVCATLAAASPLRAIRGSRKKFQKKLAIHSRIQ